MKKSLLKLSLALSLVLTILSPTAFAEKSSLDSYSINESDIVTKEMDAQNQKSKNKNKDLKSEEEVQANCIVCGEATYKAYKLSGPTLVEELFEKHLTSAWAYSNRYVWQETTTTTSTHYLKVVYK